MVEEEVGDAGQSHQHSRNLRVRWQFNRQRIRMDLIVEVGESDNGKKPCEEVGGLGRRVKVRRRRRVREIVKPVA